MDSDATDIKSIQKALVCIIRDNIFDGEELALIEPFNGPRPAVLHAGIGFISARPHQHVIKRYEKREDGFYEIIKGTRYSRFRVTFFGSGAYQKAVETQNWMKSTLGAEFILAPITGYGQIGEVQNVTSEYMGRQEERATFTVELYAKLSSEFKWMEIEKVAGEAFKNGTDAAIPLSIDKNENQ